MTKSINSEAAAELNRLQSAHGLSPGKDLDTVTLVNGQVSDNFVMPEKAHEAFTKAASAQLNWQEFTKNHPEDSPLGAVAHRALRHASLVSSLASQVLFDEDKSTEIASIEAELFDYYSPELFFGALRQKIKSLESLNLPPDLEVSRALLLERLSSFIESKDVPELKTPDKKTLEEVGNWLHSQFGDLFDQIDKEEIPVYDATQIAQYFQSAIDSTPHLHKSGWTVRVIEREKTAISTYASRKEIVIPSQRTARSTKLKTLLVHEVFGHALRSATAEEYAIPTGQNGTATYARFEESFMIALEQCLLGSHEPERGVDHYLAVGLSVTGGLSKDEIGHVFESIHMLERAKTGIDDSIRAAAFRLTKQQMSRTFVGFSDVDSGIAHRKDIDYLHGLNDSWGLLNYIVENNAVEETLPWLLSAKFNPFTKSERDLVDLYVPMPKILLAYFENNLV